MKKTTRKAAAKKPPAKKAAAKKSAPKKPATSKAKKLPSVLRRDLTTPAAAKADAALPARPSNWKAGPSTRDETAQPTHYARDIAVGKRFRKDYGDIAALARDFNANGMIQPVVISQADKLIAGERRLLAWEHKDHMLRGTPLPVRVLPIDKIILGEFAENDEALRKPFTPSEAVAIKRAIEEELRPQTTARLVAGKGAARGRARAETDRAAGVAARATGKSRRTLEKAEAIVRAAEDDPQKYGKLKADMDRTGRVDGPHKRLKTMKAAEGIRAEPPPVPGAGPYRAGMFDFPWAAEPDDDDPERAERGYYPYPTMSTAALVDYCSIKVKPILHKDFVGGFWITNFHLARGDHLPIMHALGLKPVTILTGRKNIVGRGQVACGSTEHIVLARCGKGVIETFPRTDFEFKVDKKNHSRKDQAAFDLFAKHVAAPRYFSLFDTVARGDKWDCHGDQAPAKAAGELVTEIGLLEAVDKKALNFNDASPRQDIDLFDSLVAAGFIDSSVTPIRLTGDGRARLSVLRAERTRAEKKAGRAPQPGAGETVAGADVPCPTCRARAGAWCKRPSGARAVELHPKRIQRAGEQQAKSTRVERGAEAETVHAALAAEFPAGIAGHLMVMTSDWSGGVPGESVATCQCGAVFRARRDLPMSGHDELDGDILAHWRDVMRVPLAPPAAAPAQAAE